MNFVSVICTAGIILAISMVVLMIPKYKSKNAIYIFGLLILLIFNLLSYFIDNISSVNKYPFLKGINEITLFLYGPLIYLYVKRIMLNEKGKRRYLSLLHFLLAAIVFIFLSPILYRDIGLPLLRRLNHLPLLFNRYSLGELVTDLLMFYSHILVYFYISYKLLGKKSIGKSRNKQSVNFRRVFKGYFVFAFVFVLIFFLKPVINYPNIFYQVSTALLIFHISGICYLVLNDKEFSLRINSLRVSSKKSIVSTENQKEYLQRLIDYFDSDKPYLNKDLTISMVAQDIGITSNNISFIVNENLNQRFNDFVNGYRVELAKEYLKDTSKELYTIEAIANEVGFNSKSTFNAAFKKATQQTPSQFKKAHTA